MPPRRNTLLAWLVVLIWGAAFALLTAGAYFYGGVLRPAGANPTPGASAPPALPFTLPPTWTPAPPDETDSFPGGAPSPQSRFEPTNTPVLPFTPTPTSFITPIPFFEGPIVIGYSVAGRPLEAYRFGSGPVHRLIVAGIHGGYEWNTIALADELIAHLQAHPDLIPPTVTLWIVRALNPDGYARSDGVEGRVNDNGVDLNRNFPANWLPDWDRDLCWNYTPTTGGAAPASEPETQALINFVENATRVTAILSYHSAALGIFPGGEPPHEPSVRLAEALAAVSDYHYPPIDIGCEYSGTLPDWAVSVGIASVDLELHNHEQTDFEENLRVLAAFLAWRR